MDDFLIAFGALWTVICVYAMLAYHFKESGPDTTPPSMPALWFSSESSAPEQAVSASGTAYPREARRNARRRLMRCVARSSERIRASRR